MSAFRNGCAPNREIFIHPHDSSQCKIYYLDDYQPYWEKGRQGEKKNPSFDKFSRMVLDLKQAKPSGLTYFVNWLDRILSADIAIAVVPSHDPTNTSTGLHALAAALKTGGRINASQCLERHTKVPKLAHGGDRNYQQHIDSIKAKKPQLLTGNTVVLLDDTTTSGNSMMACKTILLGSGASKVVCLALGRTVRD